MPLTQRSTSMRLFLILFAVVTSITLLVGAAPHAAAAPACGGLSPDQDLRPGQSVSSCDGRYSLDHQTDGNVVMYGPGGSVLWASGTFGRNTTSLLQQGFDGNLVLYNGSSVVWALNSSGGVPAGPDGSLAVQNDGNLVGYTTFGRPVWQRTDSTSGRTQRVQPWSGFRYEVIYTNDGNIFDELPSVTREVSIRSDGGTTVAAYFRPV